MSMEALTSRDRRIDLLAYALISVMTVFWMVSYQRVPEINEDASCYTGLAVSLSHLHYNFNYVNHVNYPPGFPAVLLLLSHLNGHQPADSYPVFMMGGLDVCRLSHSRFQLDHVAIHSEPAVSVMVDGFGILLRRIGPGLEHFKDEEIVLVDETGIGHLAFEIGETLGH